MKICSRLRALAIASFLGAGSLLAQTPSTVVYYPSHHVEEQFGLLEGLDPKKTGMFKGFQKRFGIKAQYSSDEVRAYRFPAKVPAPILMTKEQQMQEKAKRQRLIRENKVPADIIMPDKALALIEFEQMTNPETKITVASWRAMADYPWFYVHEVRRAVQNGDAPEMTPQEWSSPITEAALADVEEGRVRTPSTWPRILIRKDWSDVLYDEDRSVDGIQSRTTDDLVGASFAYSNDRQAGSESWNTVGSLIVPWFYERSVQPGLAPDNFMLAPSVSLNRLSSNGDPKKEVDQLLYRVGAMIEWYQFLPGVELLDLRLAAVYGTDSGHGASMPGFELDLEPKLLMGQNAEKEVPYKIGFRNILWRKAPTLADGSDQSLLDYQMRIWLRMEGGDIQNVSRSWDAVPEEFLRLGPVAQLRVNMPRLWRGFSITAQYSTMATLEGTSGHDSLLKLDATLNLITDKVTGRKISLNAGYVKGGMNFTAEEADMLTLGMSLLF